MDKFWSFVMLSLIYLWACGLGVMIGYAFGFKSGREANLTPLVYTAAMSESEE